MCWDEPLSMWLSPTHTESYYQDKAIEAFEQVLTATANEAEGVDFQSRVVEQSPSVELTRVAEGADLLVVGCHSRIDRHGLHLGSVASYCAHHAPCPVLIFREPTPKR